MGTTTDSDQIYCRLCLENADSTQNFVDVQANDRLIHDKIVKIFHFSLDEADFSPFICLICRDHVESVADFIETVLGNQEKLKKAKVKEGRGTNAVKQEPQGMELDYVVEDEKDFQICPLQYEDVKCEETVEDSKVQRTSSRVSASKKKNPVKEEFLCDICDKTFTSKSLLAPHMQKKHMSEPSFECEQCDRRFHTANGLASHKVQGHDFTVDISKYLVCELCEQRPMFNTFNDMNEHYQRKHDTRGFVRCCAKKFFTKRTVVYHSEVHARPVDFM